MKTNVLKASAMLQGTRTISSTCRGRLLYRDTLSTDCANIDFDKGNYLIQIGNKAFKCNL